MLLLEGSLFGGSAPLVSWVSESERIVDENDVDATFVTRKPRNQKLTADRIRRLAVHAGAGLGARGGEPEPLRVDRRGDVARAFHGGVDVVRDLIHADDEEHVLRSVCDAGNAVGVAVDVDEHAVLGYGVCAGKEPVRIIGKKHRLARVFICAAVDEVVVSVLDRLDKTNFVRAHCAAHRDRAALGNQGKRDAFRLLAVLCIVTRHIARLKSLYDFLCKQFVALCDIRIHGCSSRVLIPDYTVKTGKMQRADPCVLSERHTKRKPDGR